jgi:large subunit ribosomal protein L5
MKAKENQKLENKKQEKAKNENNSNKIEKEIFIDKLTLNIGVGEQSEKLDNAEELLKRLTGKKPVRTLAKKRVPAFGIRPGLQIGVKVTLRKKDAYEMLERLLNAKKRTLKEQNFDKNGNVSFGIQEYIDVPGIKYDPKIGMYGFDVCLTLAKKGIRVARRKLKKAKIGKRQRVSKQEAIEFIKNTFNVNII